MNHNANGNCFIFINAILSLLLSIISLIISKIFPFVNSRPFGLNINDEVRIIYILYLIFSISLIINSVLCFTKQQDFFYGELHLMLNLIFLVLIFVYPIPFILEISDIIKNIVYIPIFILFVTSSSFGIIGGIMKMRRKK